MMDYAMAMDRLDKPRWQASKVVGHRARLVRSVDKEGGKNAAYLELYDKPHIWYYPAGGIRIANQYWSRKIEDKINEYLPRGWSLNAVRLRYPERHASQWVATVDIRDEKWTLLRSMPFFNDFQFHAELGRYDLNRMNELLAEDLIPKVQTVAGETARAFLEGELDDVGLESFEWTLHGITDPAEKSRTIESLCIDAVLAERPSSALMRHVVSKRINPVERPEAERYWKEHFPYTGPTRSDLARAAALEHQMKTGRSGRRYPRNGREYALFRSHIHHALESFLLDALGFGIGER